MWISLFEFTWNWRTTLHVWHLFWDFRSYLNTAYTKICVFTCANVHMFTQNVLFTELNSNRSVFCVSGIKKIYSFFPLFMAFPQKIINPMSSKNKTNPVIASSFAKAFEHRNYCITSNFSSNLHIGFGQN